MKKITKKIAIFEYSSFGEKSCIAGVQTIKDFETTDPDQIRVSEWIEVEFTKIDDAIVINDMAKSIDERIEKIKADAMDQVAKLQGKKAELLAISHD